MRELVKGDVVIQREPWFFVGTVTGFFTHIVTKELYVVVIPQSNNHAFHICIRENLEKAKIQSPLQRSKS